MRTPTAPILYSKCLQQRHAPFASAQEAHALNIMVLAYPECRCYIEWLRCYHGDMAEVRSAIVRTQHSRWAATLGVRHVGGLSQARVEVGAAVIAAHRGKLIGALDGRIRAAQSRPATSISPHSDQECRCGSADNDVLLWAACSMHTRQSGELCWLCRLVAGVHLTHPRALCTVWAPVSLTWRDQVHGSSAACYDHPTHPHGP